MKFWSQKGVSLIEALIAMSMVGIIAIGVSSYFLTTKEFTMQVEGSTACRSDVQSLLMEYNDNTNARITNYIPFADLVGTRSLASLGQEGVEEPYNTVVSGTTQYRNYQNIENAVTRAMLLYRNGLQNNPTANYCNLTDGVLVNNTPSSIGYKNHVFQNPTVYDAVVARKQNVYFKIQPYDAASQSPLPCGSKNVSPLSTTNSAHQNTFEIQVRVVNPTTSETCVGKTVLKYNLDTRTPANNTVMTPNNCSLSAQLASTEPGSLFECSIGGSAYYLCDKTNISNIPTYNSFMSVTNPGAGKSTTLANLTITGFPNGASNIPVSIRAIDTAGNRSPATAAQVNCCIDTVWNPDPSTVCAGTVFTQTSNCGNTRPAAGTSTTGACAATPVDCVGSWTACGSCGAGLQTYSYTPATGGGSDAACLAEAALSPRACPGSAVACSGSWGTCTPNTASCGVGAGIQTYTVHSPESCGGAPCSASHGQTQSCDLAPCAPPPPTCASNAGTSCTGTQYQEWNDLIPNPPGCGGPGICTYCDYSFNRCTSAGMVSCSDMTPNSLVRCWGNYDANGTIDCSGTCNIGACAEFQGCQGKNWVHQTTACQVWVLTYNSPACP